MQVHAGVEVVKDKQEILDAQLRLSRLEMSNREQQSETRISGNMDSMQQMADLSLGVPFPNPRFPFNTTPVSQHDSYYKPSTLPHQLPELENFYDQPAYTSR